MRALSYSPPWSWAIANGHKRAENRTWNVTARGPHLIHASKRWDKSKDAAGVSADLFVHRMLTRMGVEPPQWSTIARGAIVGMATIVDCVPIERVAELKLDSLELGWCFGPYVALLVDAVPCDPVLHRGALQFFDVSEDIVQSLRFDHLSSNSLERKPA